MVVSSWSTAAAAIAAAAAAAAAAAVAVLVIAWIEIHGMMDRVNVFGEEHLDRESRRRCGSLRYLDPRMMVVSRR